MPKPSPIFYTQSGFKTLQEEFDALEVKRPEYVNELAKAAEMGDRSENAAYKYAKQRLRQTDSRIRYLQKLLNRAVIVKASQSEFVEIGSTVTLKKGEIEITYQIVGGNESDPSKGLLSYQSPLGQVLLRKKVGDEALLKLEERSILYAIVKISV